MLNKQICMKCVDENLTPWGEFGDEKLWNINGVVDCFAFLGWVKIKDGPPKKCHYLVEQFLYHDVTKTNAK